MDTDESKYYQMEFVDEDGKTYVLFYNDKDELVVRKELPKAIGTIEGFIRKKLVGDN